MGDDKVLITTKHPSGTVIGVKNIYTMISQMEGYCDVNIDNNNYIITLTFPIV